MKYITLIICTCSILFLYSCKDQPAQEAQPLKVMTFNIRLDAPSDGPNNWKYRKDDVCKMIAYYQPDLLGMQEVCHNQMEDLKQGLPQYTALGVGRDDGKEAGEYCPVFFNSQRFILIEYGNFALNETPETFGVRGWDASYNRITTWAVLQEKSNGKKIVFFNTHLDNDGRVARKESARLILSKIKEIVPDMPAVITGDFNCTPDEEPLQTLEGGGMQNASEVAAIAYGPSWSFHDFGQLPLEERMLLDYVFVTHGTKVDRYRVIQDTPDNVYLSDHYPVLVDLRMN
ncbi:endonuclease/exonuclease/phosphatase family protein [Bacteroides sp. 51]|uniref:endonuclease/exonuclease/phosphatase family protein n=1 Tax=Bacteroides sp. 51 TaxID=2302938 RepID=UPI0013D4A763|nr:endonuclease/exonuclease/phosphatase family protein [Bacteroides sp. 51]NDV84826.1 endonuclease [Bacteroides sp. 51]